MATYLLAYKDSAGMPEDEEEGKALMAAWGAWFESLGSAVKDPGNPFGPSKTVSEGGSVSDGAASGLTGYTVIEADGIDAAAEMAKGCPITSGGGSIEVYETFEVTL
jgi:hypothetical protein